MKTQRNIFIAFLLNLFFAIFEFFGGILTGSVAITSDAVHDLGDAASIGASYFLEKKSSQKPDARFTYGYIRYSLVGSLLTTAVLLIGSVAMIINAIHRILNPISINYTSMILISVVGIIINFCASIITHGGASINQKAVNLHMIEDVLGWIVVLAGAIVMKFTDFALLDPILSIVVSLYILSHAVRNLKEILNVFLEKAPDNMDADTIRNLLMRTDNILDIHHIHIWSMDGHISCATMHIVTDAEPPLIKSKIRDHLHHFGIDHVTIEIESSAECCHEKFCGIQNHTHTAAHHHHGHDHHHK